MITKEQAQKCTTHHHACDCREYELYIVLRGIAEILSSSDNDEALEAYNYINKFWIKQYGSEILNY